MKNNIVAYRGHESLFIKKVLALKSYNMQLELALAWHSNINPLHIKVP